MVKNLSTIDRSERVRIGKHVPNEQAVNTIIINASSNVIEASQEGFYLAPIRVNEAMNSNTLCYDITTNEVVDSGKALTLQGLSEAGNSTTETIQFTNNTTGFVTTSNVGIANTNPQHKLSVGGSVRHTGLVLSEGTNIDQITSITKTLGVTVSWMDTGISGTNLVTGSYIVQIEDHSDPSGGSNRNYDEYYTGFMSWWSSSTNDTDASEIILHAAGHATEDNHIYLRVLRQMSGVLKLQIRRDFDRSGQPVDYKFKFRRMI